MCVCVCVCVYVCMYVCMYVCVCVCVLHQNTLLSLIDSRAALSNPYPNACMSNKKAIFTIFMMVFGMNRPGRKHSTYRQQQQSTGARLPIVPYA